MSADLSLEERGVPQGLIEILEAARARGLIGTGDLGSHIDHSLGFATALTAVRGDGLGWQDRVIDLGSGGGLPGLVLASVSDAEVTLVEGSSNRAKWLAEAAALGPYRRPVTVRGERAEAVGRDPSMRASQSVVVARAFGQPAETAECAAPLLTVGGYLVVSEPPESAGERWEAKGLARLGLERVTVVEAGGVTFAVLRQVAACPATFPRRVGVPRKRPLFSR